MKLTLSPADAAQSAAGLLVLGRFSDAEASAAELAADKALGGALTAAATRLRFKGKARQSLTVDTLGRLPSTRVLLVGLGDRAAAGPSGLRDFGAAAALEAYAARLDTLAVALPETGNATTATRHVAEGLTLGAYRWDTFKSPDADAPAPRIESATLHGAADAGTALRQGTALAEAVAYARTLVNRPPNDLYPETLAAEAQALARQYGFTIEVLDVPELEKRGMGGILAVGKGSARPPRLFRLTWRPAGVTSDEGGYAFVGKGLTFDSGGLSLKPPKSQEDMYIDMAGSAAVLGLMKAVGELRPDVVVHGIVGTAENMPGGGAYRPSDILKMANGKTVEVLNTDAEGRLVLADALHYAAAYKPKLLIDLATLTGACMVGLGNYYAGLFTGSDAIAAQLEGAARSAGELLWRLPLDKKLGKTVDGTRGDLKNLGGPYGGAITAAIFLQHFVGETPWAHLDIAGPAMAERDDGHIRAGGTGYGVLTLWELVAGTAG